MPGLIDVYDESELAECAFARFLITGLPKAGKTTTTLCTAPGPVLVLNCDKFGAPMAAKRHGAKFKVIDVNTSGQFKEAVRYAKTEAKEGRIGSVVVDTVTMLINNVLGLEMKRKFQGFDIYREVHATAMQPVNDLLEIQAHVFLIAHFEINNGQITVEGKMKTDIPALVHDRIHLEFNPKADPQRVFYVGPSADGKSGGRSGDDAFTVEANIRKVLAKLGMNADDVTPPADEETAQ